ncbi:MAG: PepSY-like domain-containing protein [Bacteroidales bacterium]|nr:PepSY-like domain-containing protein [Bacteroidales bacterium]
MRKFLLAIALLACVLSVQAQKLRLSDIPQEVRMGLENTYTDYKLLGWYFETGQYVAEIDIDNRTGRVFLTANGNWQFTIFNVPEQELPTLVANYFINNYPGYRIKKSEYVEDFGGDNYYRLIISMKGVGQTEYEMIFDTRGKMIKTNAPDPDFVKKDYIARLNPEDIERQQKKMADRTALPGTGLEIGDENYVKANKDPENSGKKGKKVDIGTPEAIDTPKIPEIITKAFDKKYPRIEVDEWKLEDTCYNAKFQNRQGTNVQTLFKPDGSVVSVTTDVSEDRYPRLIMSDLDQRYPNAKVSIIRKVVYDAKYKRSVTDRKLEQYFYIELTEKIRGRKDVKTIKLLYDKSFKYQGLAGTGDDYEYEDE